jgi:hypothetical protein
MTTSPTRTSVVAVRKKVCTGDSHRTASSNATRASAGSCRSRCHWSGLVAKAYRTAEIPCTVVSTPAVSSDRTASGACSGVMSPRSDAAQMSAPNPTGASTSRRHWAFTQAERSATRGAPLATRSLSGPNALKAWSP